MAFKKIIAFEPDRLNFERLQEYLLGLPERVRARILAFRKAVGSYNGQVPFDSTGTVGSGMADENHPEKVELVTLDQDLPDVPSYIKMDIEGEEVEALQGCERLIAKYMPALAICVYHRWDDLWRVPLMINSFSPQHYKFFLRTYAQEGWELVCYAIPEARG
jgi:FkbM family methyltransferase